MTDGKKVGDTVIHTVFQIILELVILFLSGLRLQETGHIIDHYQDKGKRLPFDRIGITAYLQCGKKLFPLLDDAIDQPEQLRTLFRVILLQYRSAVRQVPEHLEQSAGIIHDIKLKLFRCRLFHQ